MEDAPRGEEKSARGKTIASFHSDTDAEKSASYDGPASVLANPPVESEEPLTVLSLPVPARGWRLLLIQGCICFGLLLSVMESSIVSTALVTIADDFDNFIKINWVVQAYLLTYMGFAVMISRISDVIGRKWAIIASWIVFSGFSLGCGLAQSLLQLIALRALQGIGGSGLFAMTMVSLPEMTPRTKLALMSSAIGIVFALSSVLGPILGGVITTQGNWRWVFLLNVPAGVVAIVVIFFALPGSAKTFTKNVAWKQVDFVGALLLMAASVLLVFALEEGGAAAFAWNSPTLVATLVISSCCWIGFGLWVWLLASMKATVQPIFSPRILTQRVMVVVFLNTILVGFSFFSVIIQLPERFQIVNFNTAQNAGIHLLPLLAASALGSGMGGVLSSKKNRTFYTLMAANSFILLGCGLLSTLPDQAEITNSQYGYQVLYGFGVGLTFSTVTVMTALNTEQRDTAVGQGGVSQGRVFGGSVGLAVATIVFNSRVVSTLGDVLTPTQIDGLRKSLSSVQSLTPKQQLAVVSVFAKSFNEQLRICTYIAAGCFVISLFAFQKNPPSPLSRGRGPPPPAQQQSPPQEDQV